MKTPNPLQEIVEVKEQKIIELEQKLKKTIEQIKTPNPLKVVVKEKRPRNQGA